MSNAIPNEVGIVFVPVGDGGSMLALAFRDPDGNLLMIREQE